MMAIFSMKSSITKKVKRTILDDRVPSNRSDILAIEGPMVFRTDMSEE